MDAEMEVDDTKARAVITVTPHHKLIELFDLFNATGDKALFNWNDSGCSFFALSGCHSFGMWVNFNAKDAQVSNAGSIGIFIPAVKKVLNMFGNQSYGTITIDDEFTELSLSSDKMGAKNNSTVSVFNINIDVEQLEMTIPDTYIKFIIDPAIFLQQTRMMNELCAVDMLATIQGNSIIFECKGDLGKGKSTVPVRVLERKGEDPGQVIFKIKLLQIILKQAGLISPSTVTCFMNQNMLFDQLSVESTPKFDLSLVLMSGLKDDEK